MAKSTPFGDFTKWCAPGDTNRMKMQDLRRKRLREWIEERHGGNVSRFAAAVKKAQPQIADMLRGHKSFGEKIARQLESRAGMPSGYLDGRDPAPTTPVEEPRAVYFAIPNSREEAEVGREWGKLAEPARSVIREIILLKVAAQERAARVKSSSGGPSTTKPLGGRPELST